MSTLFKLFILFYYFITINNKFGLYQVSFIFSFLEFNIGLFNRQPLLLISITILLISP